MTSSSMAERPSSSVRHLNSSVSEQHLTFVQCTSGQAQAVFPSKPWFLLGPARQEELVWRLPVQGFSDLQGCALFPELSVGLCELRSWL